MRASRPLLGALVAASLLFSSAVFAGSKLKGWVTEVDLVAQTVEVDGRTVSTRGLRVIRGPLEPGAFVSIEEGRIKVEPQRRPADDEITRYPARGPDNPGRVEFSHLRHFNALGEKACSTCHSPEMGLLTSPTYASRSTDPALEPHGPKSLGRYCATCHNGTTRFSQVGSLVGRPDMPVFTAAKTGDPRSCQRCHAPADHGADFTAAHGERAERSGGRPCLACHAQDWRPRDRQALADLLAAERTLLANPDDPNAAKVVGPNNFCIYCHRTDAEWREAERN